eukprot:gene27159-2397_t
MSRTSGREAAITSSGDEFQLGKQLEFAKELSSSMRPQSSDKDNTKSVAYHAVSAYTDLIDSIILDAAQGAHRDAAFQRPSKAAKFGAQASPGQLKVLPSSSSRKPVDVFGQSHPPKATDVVTCKNCGRQVQAGAFAPHLEKCMGKGRAAARNARWRMVGQI